MASIKSIREQMDSLPYDVHFQILSDAWHLYRYFNDDGYREMFDNLPSVKARKEEGEKLRMKMEADAVRVFNKGFK